jgi:hypothetical protein
VLTIVIVVAVVAVICYFLFATRKGGYLSVYPRASETSAFGGMGTPENFVAEWSGQHVPLGVEVKGYVTTDSLSSIMEWYRMKIPSEGWTILYDNSGYENTSLGNILLSVIICEKEGMRAGIIASEYQDLTYFALVTAPKDVFTQFIQVPGEEGAVEIHRIDVTLYAGLINENVVRIHFQHSGWDTVDNPTSKFGGSGGKSSLNENVLYGWTFTNVDRFKMGDWGRCELLIHGADFKVDDVVWVKITCGGYSLYEGQLKIQDISQLPE